MFRYGLVGRNGLGKSTLLRMVSSGQLYIPPHLSVLHVEQEVVGDETPAIQSVLSCDTVRESLLEQEKDIQRRLDNGETAGEGPDLNTQLSQVFSKPYFLVLSIICLLPTVYLLATSL